MHTFLVESIVYHKYLLATEQESYFDNIILLVYITFICRIDLIVGNCHANTVLNVFMSVLPQIHQK